MPIDGLLQPRIGSLHAGVSRQAPLLRSPSQMDEIINFLPSVDLGGLVDRVGTTCLANIGASPYLSTGAYMFRTTDGQRWLFMRRSDGGNPEIRNMTNGALATLTFGGYAASYINGATDLKFLTLADTTLVLDTAKVTAFTEPATGQPTTRAYYSIVNLSANYQTFYVSSASGTASVAYDGENSTLTREAVAAQLEQACANGMPGLGISRIGSVLRFEGSAALIQSITGGNDWDSAACVLIKGRVDALTDLPSVFFQGEPILVDLNDGDLTTSYWITYDAVTNSYKETSYLDNFATAGNWDVSTMPMRIHKTGTNSFEITTIDWVARSVGDDNSNPPANFNGAAITDMTMWKGRLWFASGSWVISSQPDDLFNFWKGSGREVVASDPVQQQAEEDQGNVGHLVSFRDTLMVFLKDTQGYIDGTQAITPTTASIANATAYDVDPDCQPTAIGNVIQYTGTQEGRSVLWEYQFNEATENNYAEDLSKHIPRYCPGSIRRIVGSSQAGRTFLWSALDVATLYVQTSYWKDQQRAQNAWSKVTFAQMTNIWLHWVDEGNLYVLGQTGTGYLTLASVPVDSNLGEEPTTDLRLDMRQPIQITWNATLLRSEVVLPEGYYQLTGLTVCVLNTSGWFDEFTLSTVYSGSQWIGYFSQQVTSTVCYIGVRFPRSFRFSPFYATIGQSQTPLGRFMVHKLYLDCLRSGDFTATLSRSDRTDMVVQLSPRTIGAALVADDGENQTYPIPFNSQGNKASMTVSTDSTGPMIVTGYTLAARYTNLFANA